MQPKEMKELNKEKNKVFIYPAIVLIIFICLSIFKIIPVKIDFILVVSIAIIMVLPVLMFHFFVRKVEKILVPYVLSQCSDWNMDVSFSKNLDFKKNTEWNTDLIPPKEYMLSTVLPVFVLPLVNIKLFDSQLLLSLRNAFSHNNDTLKRTITQIQYISRSSGKGKPVLQFYAGMISVRNTKNLNSITYFQTKNYPKGTDKDIIKEKPELELPKINLADAYQYNIDVYSNNQSVAEKLATQDLFSTMQSIKQQLNLCYVKAVFYNDYIMFVLRHNGWGFLRYPTFSIEIPVFKNIDYPLLEQAVNNFKALTDLANQAPEFTKNI